MESDGRQGPPSFSNQIEGLKRAFDSLLPRTLLLFGGKGGVGKTTISSLAALHLSSQRPVVLFSSDPASNLRDLSGGEEITDITIEQLDAETLYEEYLSINLDNFLELGDRGTYLDKSEMRRLLELSLPGIDELMAWMRIGDLVKANPGKIVITDTAPTGHTLRMLSSGDHFEGFGAALEAMQQKHRELVEQLTRRRVRDGIDDFISRFRAESSERRALLQDSSRSAFIPVSLSEPWVREQTKRMTLELIRMEIDFPFIILNHAVSLPDCDNCRRRAERDRSTEHDSAGTIVLAPHSCTSLDSVERLRAYLAGGESGEARPPRALPVSGSLHVRSETRLLFFAGKGGVGKTTTASSVALQFAAGNPDKVFTLISVDPAHTLRDVFAHEPPPENLRLETIDTREKWQRLRTSIGRDIENAIASMTPRGVSIRHDSDVMQRLIELAPPGADELFAILRLQELMDENLSALVIVDTAPTGHFLRLLDLPHTAREWVHEFMRILLNYRELIPPNSLGEELVRISRALNRFQEALQSTDSAVVVVTRPERIVALETQRLAEELRERKVPVAGFIANYVTPPSSCPCEQIMRSDEAEALMAFSPLTIVNRQAEPVTVLADLQKLVAISQTER